MDHRSKRGTKLQAELDATDKLDGIKFLEEYKLKHKLRKLVDGLVNRVKKIKRKLRLLVL
ncbi:hypothetical protein KXD40_007425 [Peronospora effusa]|nr:hypothetical protein KXD40_007425 [Peronospora effusa]